ncbi:hypothetical protein PFLUV_G00199980 [Perca fluviatilis]|uniref:Uncharacterized protein n=1 Tax=Perca fluviatilis TaxID=8168 RepID=A0A6A5EE94_PERFL|nr:hypothetical protein PFLUV_G00199980 [Perca fluviatilis]
MYFKCTQINWQWSTDANQCRTRTTDIDLTEYRSSAGGGSEATDTSRSVSEGRQFTSPTSSSTLETFISDLRFKNTL